MTAQDLKSSILQLAVQGKLVPQDPNDEPAADVLNRVFSGKCSRRDIISEEEIICDIPSSWEWIRLKDVCIIARGGSPRPIGSYLTEAQDGINWIKIGDTEQGGKYIISTAEKIKPEGLQYSRLVEPDDFLLTNSMSFGRPYICKTTGAIHDGWLTISFDKAVYDIDFLFYLLSSPMIFAQFSSLAAGSGVKNLKIEKVENTLAVVPPIAEQQRIVAKIEELLPYISEYDAAEKRLTLLNAEFPGKLRKSILQDAVQGKLTERNPTDEPTSELLKRICTEKASLIAHGKIKKEKPLPPITEDEIPFEIPETWEWVKLGDICGKIGAGSTPKGGSNVYVSNGIKFLREQNVHDDGLRLDNVVFIDEKTNAEKKGSQVFAQDILMNITGGSIGRNALVPDDFDLANVNQHVLILRLVDKNLRYYIHYCLCSPAVLNQMFSKQSGDKPGLSATKVNNFVIPIPPVAEQQRIVARLEEMMTLCGRLK